MACDLNFSRSPSRCTDITSVSFPFIWFSMAVHTSGGCARRVAAIIPRPWTREAPVLVYARSCSNGANVRHVRATLKSRFAESQVGQPDVAFPRGKLYSRIKAFFSEFLVAEHYCFLHPSAGFLPSSFSTLQTGIKKSDAVSWLVHFLPS